MATLGHRRSLAHASRIALGATRRAMQEAMERRYRQHGRKWASAVTRREVRRRREPSASGRGSRGSRRPCPCRRPGGGGSHRGSSTPRHALRVAGLDVSGPCVIHSPTTASGTRPCATARRTSRSVKTPTRRPPSRTSAAPTRRSFMLLTASVSRASASTVSRSRAIRSATRCMARVSGAQPIVPSRACRRPRAAADACACPALDDGEGRTRQ